MRRLMEVLMELPDHPVYVALIFVVSVGSMLTFVAI